MELLAGIIFAIALVWALINIMTSDEQTGTKFVWFLIILFVPVIGFIVWFFAGPRSKNGSIS